MNKYLLDTDIVIDYLTSEENENGYLLNLMQDGICFITVLNAAELLAYCSNEKEKDVVRCVLDSLKVLGLHSRYALSVPEFFKETGSIRDALFTATASINKIPIVTFDKERYKKTKLKIIHPQELRK